MYNTKPIIIFQAAGAGDYFPESYPASYNYAYIDAFERFYFVTEWEWAERNWIATLEVDPLATYKGDIGTGTHYVERCSGTFNGRIADTVYPVMTDPSVTITDIESPWINETYYIVGISGGGGSTGITYYIFHPLSIQHSFKIFIIVIHGGTLQRQMLLTTPQYSIRWTL